MRHIGRVRLNSKKEEVREILLVEALARTIKAQLRALYRERMQQLTAPSSDPFLEITVEVFNLVIGSGEYSDKSKLYWEGILKEELVGKFEKIFSEKELAENLTLRSRVDWRSACQLVCRLAEMMNIKFSESANKEFTTQKISQLILVISDVVSVDTKVKHLNLIDYAAGMAMVYKSVNADPSTAKRLLSSAEETLTVTFFFFNIIQLILKQKKESIKFTFNQCRN